MSFLFKKICIASDHAGFKLKEIIKDHLINKHVSIFDLGPYINKSVDYPDYAKKLASRVKAKKSDIGILVCGSGTGMAISANKIKDIRAAVCYNPKSTRLSRQHNNANIIALGARLTNKNLSLKLVELFLKTKFEGGRHLKGLKNIMSVIKLDKYLNSFFKLKLQDADKELYDSIRDEFSRQQNHIELIASENIVSKAVLEAQGSVLTNKYAEGYPGKRYYGGCDHVDVSENLAIERAKKLFDCKFANVQPHSGAQANGAVYLALLKPGDTTLAMSLNSGGHLTHGAKPAQSGKWFNALHYEVDKNTGLIDYESIEKLATEKKPKLIIAGGSAYSRIIDFKRFRDICDKVGAYLLVDMAHFSGLVAGGEYPNPTKYADVVTSTTHKVLRGPRGGIILTNREDLIKKFNSAIFPGLQGGPLMHVIAAKAVCFKEALSEDFKIYTKNVIKNAKILSDSLSKKGFKIFSGGTDTHLMLLDLRSFNVTGKDAQASLGNANITCNKNGIPFDTQSPMITSGIRLGTPACTTRGFKENEFKLISELIYKVVKGLSENKEDNSKIEKEVKKEIVDLCAAFPIYGN